MSAALLEWFDANQRSFPWRPSTDPWIILVSEVMSQQTQIDRVVQRFGPFIDLFPTPQALADASVAELLTAWSGLGYNRRALNLKATAEQVAQRGWPTTSTDLRTLPGIGPYTAAAVACFAFGEQVAAVDTNLKRVLSRWAGKPLSGTELWAEAARRVPEGRAGDWNGAMMDLGASICKPRPLCDRCPAVAECADPTVYVPPPKQAKFEGSMRQTRGAILKLLIGGDELTEGEIKAAIGQPEHTAAALSALCTEGLVAATGDRFTVAS